MTDKKLSLPSVAEWLGLTRSLLMYYAVPGRAHAWRRFYRSFVSPGDLCLDIGAHVGNRSAAMLAIGARVVAVEPQPLMAAVLLGKYGARPHFHLVSKAVGAKAGKAEMLVSTRTPTVSTLSGSWARQVGRSRSFSDVRWDGRMEIGVTTLDALVAEFGIPTFSKLDIEGYELEALSGLSQPLPAISIEYLPMAKDRAMACVERLMELGDYAFNVIHGEYPRFALTAWVSASAVRDLIMRLPAEGRAGEVYARLGV
ncbi:MAG: FkbM family methyltransferase [Chloroflexi bacterium]|nr:FkbM family methyltransferase [Chloroflexota bacterium]